MVVPHALELLDEPVQAVYLYLHVLVQTAIPGGDQLRHLRKSRRGGPVVIATVQLLQHFRRFTDESANHMQRFVTYNVQNDVASLSVTASLLLKFDRLWSFSAELLESMPTTRRMPNNA